MKHRSRCAELTPASLPPTDGLRRQDSYCLLVRVVKDAVGLSEQDVQLPAHAWNEDTAVDICESCIGCPAGTYKVQLLSDKEFLLRKRLTSGPEMNWQDANAIITHPWTFPLVWSERCCPSSGRTARSLLLAQKSHSPEAEV